MTSTLFFLTVISLGDKWNHMLAAVLGRKTEQEVGGGGSFSMMLEVGGGDNGERTRAARSDDKFVLPRGCQTELQLRAFPLALPPGLRVHCS